MFKFGKIMYVDVRHRAWPGRFKMLNTWSLCELSKSWTMTFVVRLIAEMFEEGTGLSIIPRLVLIGLC